MSFIKVWIHYVWATKNHEAALQKGSREILFSHILEVNRKKGIWVDTVNGYSNSSFGDKFALLNFSFKPRYC